METEITIRRKQINISSSTAAKGGVDIEIKRTQGAYHDSFSVVVADKA